MSIAELYSRYLSQSHGASSRHSDYDDHDDGSDHDDTSWGHDDNSFSGEHVDYNKNYTECYENHSDHNDHSVHTSIREVRYQPKENAGMYVNYSGNFAVNFWTEGEIRTRIIFQGYFKNNSQGDEIKIFDSRGNTIFQGGGTIILEDDGDFEIHEGEILSTGDEEYDGEEYDGEEYDGEDFDGEEYDEEDFDGEEYDGEEYDGEEYDEEDFDGDFVMDFMSGDEIRTRIIFQGDFEIDSQGDEIKITTDYDDIFFRLDNVLSRGDIKIFDSYDRNVFEISSETVRNDEGNVIFQGGGTIILQDYGEFEVYEGKILFADDYDEGHVDYYEGGSHDDHDDHTDRYDHSDSGGHSDYDDDY